MKSDRVFILMLVILLPMSGCFENSVGDAEGQVEPGDPVDSNDDEDLTVINNYYNNVTSSEIYVTSGSYGFCGEWTNTTTANGTDSNCNYYTTPAAGEYEYISISAGTTIKIHGISASSIYGNMYFKLECQSFELEIYQHYQTTMTTIATDGGECSLSNSGAYNNYNQGSWAIAYEVVPVIIA